MDSVLLGAGACSCRHAAGCPPSLLSVDPDSSRRTEHNSRSRCQMSTLSFLKREEQLECVRRLGSDLALWLTAISVQGHTCCVSIPVFFTKIKVIFLKFVFKTCAKLCNIDCWRWGLLMPGLNKCLRPHVSRTRGQSHGAPACSLSLFAPRPRHFSYFCSLKKKIKKAIGRKESRVADLRALSGTRGRSEVYLQSSTPLLLVAQSCFPALEASWRD